MGRRAPSALGAGGAPNPGTGDPPGRWVTHIGPVARLPRWAWWNPAGAQRPWTVGIEDEVMLLEPDGWTLANRIADVVATLPPDLTGRVFAETHACVVELSSSPHETVAGAAAEVAGLRRGVAAVLDRLRLRAAVSGTHPSARSGDVEISPMTRYREVQASMRGLARREPTCALHVHVAVPDPDAAVRALAGLRRDLPLLLALSANSPYWHGCDSGLASARTPLFAMFPRVGIPRRFERYRDYVDAVEVLVQGHAIPDPSFLWWDVRLRPHLGTVEVRIMDAQTHVADAAALAALVQCLVVLHAEGRVAAEAPTPEALAENRFLAARDGVDAVFLEPGLARTRRARDRLAELLGGCAAVARALGCGAELEAVAALAEHPGHRRQRAVAGEHGLVGLTETLANAFGPEPRMAAA